ncbi:MAG: hypothetical protein HN348_13215, partial [Proteobacteria bacterium]|nr:hypothetical protein [Pseudomonadota bacterium]
MLRKRVIAGIIIAGIMFLLTGNSAWADPVSFNVTITNSSSSSWTEGVVAILPEGGTDVLIELGPTPVTPDQYYTYQFIHSQCDPNGEDDGDASLLISRWSTLTEEVNAYVVPALNVGEDAAVTIEANPGDVMSFVARVRASQDDGVMMHTVGDTSDSSLALFDGGGAPLQSLQFDIVGIDVRSKGAKCPPDPSSNVTIGGDGGADQPDDPVTCLVQDWFDDADGDGYGGDTYDQSCGPNGQQVLNSDDCDDTDSGITLEETWHHDGDADTFGDPLDSKLDCPNVMPVDYVRNSLDCDDEDGAEFPNQTWYADCDADAYCKGTPITQCLVPGTDCSDGQSPDGGWSNVDPGVDADCDDEDGAQYPDQTWYADCDADTYYKGTPITQCEEPDTDCGWKNSSPLGDSDCDDGNDTINLGVTWYYDGDVDGFGDPHVGQTGCPADLVGYVDNADDCDDSSTSITVEVTWYHDNDGDSFGDPLASLG